MEVFLFPDGGGLYLVVGASFVLPSSGRRRNLALFLVVDVFSGGGYSLWTLHVGGHLDRGEL